MSAGRELHDVADRLHSIAIHLLRRLRKVDEATGLSGPRLSAMSVLVFGGPLPVSKLAAAEQVRVPTMTRLVQALEEEGFVRRHSDPLDARVSRVEATPRGRKVLLDGRQRRVQMLAGILSELSPPERRTVRDAVAALETVIAGRATALPPPTAPVEPAGGGPMASPA